MPVDSSGKDRRPSRRLGTEERHREQEARRARGEIACAECNRLKLRCDKKVPCSSCIRRGCSAICPNSSLSTGQGTRFVLADTEQLHRKLVEMSERIRQLEDALAIETAHSATPHPLLREELMGIKRGIEVFNVSARDKAQDDCFDDFGTLTISDSGVSRFIGRTGGSESLLMANLEIDPGPPSESEESWSEGNPSTTYDTEDILTPITAPETMLLADRVIQIQATLPPWERAWTLCETYLEQSTWQIRLVSRSQLIDDLLSPIYKGRSCPSIDDPDADACKPAQELALLLMVFAMGALADLTLPPYNDEAEQYYQLAHSLVNLDNAADSPSLVVIQTLGLMSNFLMVNDRTESLERIFATMSFANVLALTIGLHRDPSRWNLDEKTKQTRRQVFWQLFVVQALQGLASGRPTMFNLRFVDCQFPDDDEQTVDANGNVEPGCWRWRYSFAKDIIDTINELTCATGTVKYSDILEVDRKIREMKIPKELQVPIGGSNWETDGPYKVMQRMMPVVHRDIVMLFIHRSYFAKALVDHPLNPLKSPYAPSFLSTYRSALALLKVSRDHFELSPSFMLRAWVLWKHVFSALMVLGTIVIRGPTSTLAPAALAELNLGISFFENCAEIGDWARRALSVLRRMQDKACSTFSMQRSGKAPADDASSNSSSGKKREEAFDELAVFGGQGKKTSKRGSPGAGPSSSRFSSPSSVAASPPVSQNDVPSPGETVPHTPVQLFSHPVYASPHPTDVVATHPVPVHHHPTTAPLDQDQQALNAYWAEHVQAAHYGTYVPPPQTAHVEQEAIQHYEAMAHPDARGMYNPYSTPIQGADARRPYPDSGMVEGWSAFLQGSGFMNPSAPTQWS